jgi:hypothetical protein
MGLKNSFFLLIEVLLVGNKKAKGDLQAVELEFFEFLRTIDWIGQRNAIL